MPGLHADACDLAVRNRAFAFLSEQARLHPNGIPWTVLHAGFTIDGQRVLLLSQQGIFKPNGKRMVNGLCRLVEVTGDGPT
jgi:hypothetical protein